VSAARSAGAPPAPPSAGDKGDRERVDAPAKLTLSLRVTGVRADGFHLIDAEMVSISLADELVFSPGSGLTVVDEVPGGLGVARVPADGDNLVERALRAVGRSAAIHLHKRIPTGAGLGGGSADAAAVLRWAGVRDNEFAARLGADVPFCVAGGRARVTGIGEVLDPLAVEARHFVLLLLPIFVDTAAVYRAWDEQRARGGRPGDDSNAPGGNDLEAPALEVQPALVPWKERFAEVTGVRPRLAGSGSAWFVEGTPAQVGLEGLAFVARGEVRAPLVAVSTLPSASTGFPSNAGRGGGG
jgi:4-diphosphocytidyl-2-C-methyl-D-erythritol kinase